MLWYLVSGVHLSVILFVVLSPFIGSIDILLLHLVVIPFLVAHWVFNNDTCFLTELEKLLSGRSKSDLITYKIMSPIYRFIGSNIEHSRIIYIVTTILWTISFVRLVRKICRKI